MKRQLWYAGRRVADGWIVFTRDGWLTFAAMVPFLLVFTPIVFLKALFFEDIS